MVMPSAPTTRLVAILVAVALLGAVGGGVAAYAHGRRQLAAVAAAARSDGDAALRLEEAHKLIDELAVEIATTTTAIASVERELGEKKSHIARLEAAVERKDAEVRRPTSPAARARRVAVLTRSSTAAVVPAQLDGRPAFLVAEETFLRLQFAAEVRPLLEEQLSLERARGDLEHDRAEFALQEVTLHLQERDVLRIAWAAAETDRADLADQLHVVASAPPWVTYVAIAAGSLVLGASIGFAAD